MPEGIRVAAPPPKPLLVFDGDCNFCALWIRRWAQLTGDAVDYLPSKDPTVASRFPEIPREFFVVSVLLIEPDGIVHSGAEAVFLALARNPRWRWPLIAYRQFRPLAAGTEWAYRSVARHRVFFSTLTRVFWGRHVELPDYFLTRWLFLRSLGLVYLFAFVSLWMQVGGLIGHDGILPAGKFMADAGQICNARGIGLERYHLLPTLCWISGSDGFLYFQCAAGAVLAMLLVLGIAPVPCLGLSWLLYLSLVTVGREFLSFQWDNLLLETGFLAIFLAPLQWLPKFSREPPPSRLMLWLLRLLLFKLMFSSGCVKLLSGDPNWRDLTALTFHYYTQPLPPWTAWYANQLPFWFQKISCALVLGIELGAPFLILGPRRVRFAGAAALAGLQLLILITGNYAFFNWISLALCLLLLDDFALKAKLPARWGAACLRRATPAGLSWPRPVSIGVAIVTLPASLFLLAVTAGVRSRALALPAIVAEQLAPFRTVNNYGLFAVMTAQRNEIIVEGSRDGTNWLAYEFKYKPGDTQRRPAFIAPFQPRLDWQMWFAALGDAGQNPWFVGFCERLLRGSPAVLALLGKNPFPGQPPRFIRAELYNYHFTTAAERRVTGDWWRREFAGEYLAPISLRETNATLEP